MKKLLFVLSGFLLVLNSYAQNADLIARAESCISNSDLKELRTRAEALDDGYADLYIGIGLHNIAQTDSSLVAEAMSRLKKVRGAKNSVLALAYLGSVQTIRAGHYFTDEKILEACADLAEGVKMIDEAVEMEPQNLNIRMLRIVNGFSLSSESPVQRYAEIAKDLDFLKQQLDSFNNGKKAFYWYFCGRLCLVNNEWDQAFDAMERAIAVSPDSAHAVMAGDLLWELEE